MNHRLPWGNSRAWRPEAERGFLRTTEEDGAGREVECGALEWPFGDNQAPRLCLGRGLLRQLWVLTCLPG